MPVCDICNTQIPGGSTVIANTQMKVAILQGFNPFKAGLAPNAVVLGTLAGRSEEQVYGNWKQMALADTTDWMLCPTCARGFENATR